MGVPSIVPLVINNPSLFEKLLLRNCNLVVDGKCLENYLYNNINIDKQYGGDYDIYSTKVEDLFDIFLKLRINPIVVFDGGYEIDDRKKATLMKRAQNRINDPENFAPLLIHETFVCVLRRLRIKHVTCDFEADFEMVVLANQLRCPVLSFDSDFFIFEVEKGYIPIKELNINKLLQGQKPTKIEVSIYYTRNLTRKFRFLEGKLGILASALGNDYIAKDSQAVQRFYKTLTLPKPDRQIFETPNEHFCAIIRKVLYWLERVDIVNGKKELTQFMNPEEQRLATLSMKTYCSSTEYSTFDLKAFLENPSMDMSTARGVMPLWFTHGHRLGLLPNFFQNTILNRRNILLCQVEDTTKVSAYECSLSLRQSVYGILLGTKKPVEEYDRQGRELQCKTIFGIYTKVSGNDLNCDTISELANDEKRRALRQILDAAEPGKRIQQINSESSLFLMILIYWLKKSNLSAESNLLRSILISFVILSLRKHHNTSPETLDYIDEWINQDEDSYAGECMPDLNALAQLQSCLKF